MSLPEARLLLSGTYLEPWHVLCAPRQLTDARMPSLQLCQALKFCKSLCIIAVAIESLQCLSIDLEGLPNIRGKLDAALVSNFVS